MNRNQPVSIFFATDNNYVHCLSVAIKSICENCHPAFDYNVHILNTGLTKQNIEKLKSLQMPNFTIEFDDVSEKIAAVKRLLDENLRDYYTDAIYYRIFIPKMFPECHRAIYLDCDMVVLGDISKLFFTDLEDKYIAGCNDEIVSGAEVFRNYASYAVGINHKKYINSGMLLMDLDKLREIEIDQKFIELLKKYNFNTVVPDQDYINIICKNHIKILDQSWDKMSTKRKYTGDLNIIHYNLYRKPWLYKKVPYESYFWQYAGLTPYYNELRNLNGSLTKQQKRANVEGMKQLIKAARRITLEPDNFKNVLKNKTIDEAIKDKEVIKMDNLSVEERIKEYEKLGGEYFNTDVKDDPPYLPLKNVDYLKKKLGNKINAFFANSIAKSFRKKIRKQTDLKIVGAENLAGIKGAIITHNHFSEADSVGIYWATKLFEGKKRKMYTLVREGNWSMPGLIGYFLKHCNTLPISQNYRNMVNLDKAITTIVNRGDLVLIYPEQAMWPNYLKPRPQKLGAFFYASKNNVPVVPMFTTVDEGKFTLHILKPIYPNPELSPKENAKIMCQNNYEQFKDCYESVYGTPLSYNQ